ncbi:MAG: DNA topoisomerase 4 subunit A [Clostridia bacterium]|nr:DNA topoisomerase 4 subunit A [Clostridia bacterium]
MARKDKNDNYFIPLEQQNVLMQTMEDVLHNSMMPYAEHVVLERALPRVEDGLKPVQRRVLYAMYTLGLTPDKQTKKSAHIVGECMAKYHPHGDSSIYDTMVRLAQDFNLRVPLVYGQGNFGSIDGDPAAAFRYTEAKLAAPAMELLADLDKDTVPWDLNFDDTTKEPTLLPGRFPNLLVNGSYGIAVGFATNIPTHNLAEVIDGVIAQMDNPRITTEELCKIVKGPDFPTGGYILNGADIVETYKTGKGKLTVRAKTQIENAPNGKKLIVITEIPYGVNKARMLADILKLSEEKKGILTAINDIRDESDMNTGMRAVIELKRDSDPEKILQYLYKYSDLQNTFGVNIVAIADGKPKQLGLHEINRYYIEHYRTVERRRVKHDLEKARIEEEIQRGLLVAIQNIDEVVHIIKTSENVRTARERLRERFELSERQANAILDMRLARLTALEVNTIKERLAALQALIAELTGLLESKQKLNAYIKKCLLDVKRKYKSPRRTQILSGAPEKPITVDDFKVVEECVVGIDVLGSIKRVSAKNFNRSSKEIKQYGDITKCLVSTKTDERLYLFTDLGNCYTLSVEDIPECKWRDKGTSKEKLISGFDAEERIIFALVCKELTEDKLYFMTKNGMVKASKLTEYAVRKPKFAAIGLKDGDRVIAIERDCEGTSILFVTANGMSLNMTKEDVPVTGRVTGGVKGISLDDGDKAVFAAQINDEGEIIVVTDKGYAKRSLAVEYELSVRARKGLKTFDFKKTGSNGSEIAGAVWVREPFDMYLLHQSGEIENLNTDSLLIESRLSPGKPYVLVVMGDIITEVVKDNS